MSNIFSLDWRDFAKGAVVAAFTGAFLPIAAAIQTQDFSIATVNWDQIWILAVNGAIIGFFGYLSKNFLTDGQGKFGGVL